MQPTVRFVATSVVVGAQGDVAQLDAIRAWLVGNVQFIRDPAGGVEYLTDPVALLQQGYRSGLLQGDCDDIAMLAAALGMAIGFRARLVVVGTQQSYQHVFTELAPPWGPAKWREMDITRPLQGIPSTFSRGFAVEV